MRVLRSSLFMVGLLIAVSWTFSGCATVRGVGEDIQSAGRALERTANDVSR